MQSIRITHPAGIIWQSTCPNGIGRSLNHEAAEADGWIAIHYFGLKAPSRALQ